MKLPAAVLLSLSLLPSSSIAVSNGEDARLAGVVVVGEELGRSIFLCFGVVAARAGFSSPAASVLSIIERFF
jgi:hypothetical protein